MTIQIANIAVDAPIKQSDMVQVVHNVNGSPGRQVFTANGTFTIPEGVHQFKVTLSGGGGRGGQQQDGWDGTVFDFHGGSSPMVSKIIAGQDVGASFTVTIGAGGTSGSPNGGTTSFGALLQSTGGIGGVSGADGTHTGDLRHGNMLFQSGASQRIVGSNGSVDRTQGHGQGGFGDQNGAPGICVVEW